MLLMSVKQFSVKSGNPWRDARGQFASSPPGVKVIGESLQFLEKLQPQDKAAIDQYVKKVGAKNIKASGTSNPNVLSIGLQGSNGAVGFNIEIGKGSDGISNIKSDNGEKLQLPVIKQDTQNTVQNGDIDSVISGLKADGLDVKDEDVLRESLSSSYGKLLSEGNKLSKEFKDFSDEFLKNTGIGKIIGINTFFAIYNLFVPKSTK